MLLAVTEGNFGPLWHAAWFLVPLAVAVLLTQPAGRGFSLPARARRSASVAAWLTGCILLLMATSATADVWFYFSRWNPHVFSLRSGPIRLAGVMLGAVLLFRFAPKAFPWVLAAAFVVSAGGAFHRLISETGGLPIYQFDHPAFMHRLWGLTQALPSVAYYDPTWNAGKVNSHCMSSGLAPAAWMLAPLWRAGVGIDVYTASLGVLHILLVPAVCAWAARIAGARAGGVAAAALLGLCTSHYQFLWAIHFGTMGASVCMPFLAVAAASLYAILWRDDTRPIVVASLAVSAAVYLSWPGSFIMGLCVLPALAVSLPRMRGRRLAWIAAAGLIMMVLLLPVLNGVLSHSDPAGFAGMQSRDVDPAKDFIRGWHNLLESFRSMHPLIVFLGGAGMFFLPDRGARRFFPALCLVLVLLTGWGQTWKPQFQLERAVVPLGYVLVLPCVLWIDRAARKRGLLFTKAALAALLCAGGYNAIRLYANRGPAPYHAMRPDTPAFADWLKVHSAPGSRVLFAGPTVHGYGGAQISLMPVLADREMIACDFYNFSPKRVEYEMPPRPFRETPERVRAYLDLLGVGHVATYHAHWIEFFGKHTNDYEHVYIFGNKTKKHVYRVLNPAPRLASGRAAVTAGVNRIHVIPEGTPEEIVLRYRWVDGLHVDAPAEIFPADMGDEIRFIGLRPHGAAACTIRYGGRP